MPTSLLLVRHGETEFNRVGRVQGWIDEPLNETGLQQAALIAKRLQHETAHAIYASDLQRARVTAEQIGQLLKLPVQPDERLREHGLGDLEGLNYEEIRARYPERAARQLNSRQRVPAPNEEPYEQFMTRVRTSVDEIVARHANQTVLIVAHGGTLHALLASYLHMDLQATVFLFGNTSLSKVSFEGQRFRVHFLNDLHHLSGATALM